MSLIGQGYTYLGVRKELAKGCGLEQVPVTSCDITSYHQPSQAKISDKFSNDISSLQPAQTPGDLLIEKISPYWVDVYGRLPYKVFVDEWVSCQVIYIYVL